MFDAGDGPGAPHAALVSRSLAERAWPGEDPIGKLVNFGGMDGDLTPLEIVGVVGDVRDGLDAPPRDTIYAYYRQRPGGHLAAFSIALRGPDPGALVPAARDVVRTLEPRAYAAAALALLLAAAAAASLPALRAARVDPLTALRHE